MPVTAQTIRDALLEVPFKPFILKMNNGDVFDVRHPEFVQVTMHSVVLYWPSKLPGIAEDVRKTLSIRNISSLEPIDDETQAA